MAVALEDGVPYIFRADQGCQFTSRDLTGRLLIEQLLISIDAHDWTLDNVLIERFWHSIKYEDIYLRDNGSVLELEQGLAD